MASQRVYMSAVKTAFTSIKLFQIAVLRGQICVKQQEMIIFQLQDSTESQRTMTLNHHLEVIFL